MLHLEPTRRHPNSTSAERFGEGDRRCDALVLVWDRARVGALVGMLSAAFGRGPSSTPVKRPGFVALHRRKCHGAAATRHLVFRLDKMSLRPAATQQSLEPWRVADPPSQSQIPPRHLLGRYAFDAVARSASSLMRRSTSERQPLRSEFRPYFASTSLSACAPNWRLVQMDKRGIRARGVALRGPGRAERSPKADACPASNSAIN